MTNILTTNKETDINHLISRVIDIKLGHTAFMCNVFQEVSDQGSPQLSILVFFYCYSYSLFSTLITKACSVGYSLFWSYLCLLIGKSFETTFRNFKPLINILYISVVYQFSLKLNRALHGFTGVLL